MDGNLANDNKIHKVYVEFTDLGDVHDLDGRQLSRLDMSTLERQTEERRDKGKVNLCFLSPMQHAQHHSHLPIDVPIVQV